MNTPLISRGELYCICICIYGYFVFLKVTWSLGKLALGFKIKIRRFNAMTSFLAIE
jgi:hypothetical protein